MVLDLRLTGCWSLEDLPLKKATFLNFLGNMGYMFVKDENFPRAQGVLRGKKRSRMDPAAHVGNCWSILRLPQSFIDSRKPL